MSAETHFKRRLNSALATVLAYEDSAAQELVREHIDFDAIFQYLCEEQEKQALEKKVNPRSIEELAIIALMRWFKCDFFKWCNKPACDNLDCDGRPHHMEPEGMAAPTVSEERDGGASRVEVYRCKLCHRVSRFPRYNNVPYMVKHSRRGRCGEFANVFGMVLRSLGFDVRYVLDFTDHVWVEVWVEALQRFVHCDPCERALDAPLGYEAGWKKKLTHVLSCSRYGVDDAISRYTREQDEVLIRRGMEYPEDLVQQYIAVKDTELEARFASNTISTASLSFHSQEFPSSLFEKFSFGKRSFENLPELPIEVMMTRRLLHKADLESMMFLRPGHLSAAEQHGRISGDLAWRQQRGEIKPEEAIAEATTLPTIDEETVCGVDENSLCTTGHDRSESIILQNLWRQAKEAGRFSWFMNTPGLILSRSCASNEIMFQLPFQSHMSNYRLQQPSTSYSMTITIQNTHFPVRKEGVHVYFISNLYHALYSEDASLNDNLIEKLFLSSSSESHSAPSSFITSALSSSCGGVILVHIDSRESLSLYPHLVEGLKKAFYISQDVLDRIISENKFYIVATIQDNVVFPQSVQVLYCSSLALTTISGPEDAAQITSEVLPCIAKVWVTKQHVATQEQHSQRINNDSSSPFSSEILVKLENHLCTNVSEVILANESDTFETLQAKAMAALLSDKEQSLIGFTIVPDANNHSMWQSALLFAADQGLSSWKMMKGTHSYLLSAATLFLPSSSSSSSGVSVPNFFHRFDSSSMHIATYHDIGGGTHGDTLHFDAMDLVASSQWSLSQIDLWAGPSLSNGIQCHYHYKSNVADDIDAEQLTTPIFSSSEGSPAKYSLSLLASPSSHSSNDVAGYNSAPLEMRKIVKLVVHAGALIDGLILQTNDGDVLSVGGNGGQRVQINFDERCTLLGFYGGCGGHLHNLGVVTQHVLGNALESSTSQLAIHKEALLPENVLVPIYERYAFYDQIKYLNSVQFDNFHVSHCQHNDLPALSHILRSMLSLNDDRRVVVTAMQTLIAYLKNIHKNPLEEKYQTMKLRNAVVGRILAAKGILPLVGFGPAAFHLTSDGLCLQSRWKRIIDRLPQQLSRKDLIRSLKAYIDCLSEITTFIERL